MEINIRDFVLCTVAVWVFVHFDVCGGRRQIAFGAKVFHVIKCRVLEVAKSCFVDQIHDSRTGWYEGKHCKYGRNAKRLRTLPFELRSDGGRDDYDRNKRPERELKWKY